MTSPLPTVPIAASNPDLEKGLAELDKATPAYEKAAQFFDGKRDEVFASPKLRRLMRRLGINLTFNFAKTPVNAVVERLEISSITSTADGVTAKLSDIWRHNELDVEAPGIHRKAGEFGDGYVMVWPEDDETEVLDESAEEKGGYTRVGIYWNDPTTCRVFYDPEVPRKKHHAIKRWQLADKRWRVDLLYPHTIERYISKPGSKAESSTDFVPYVVDFEIDEETEQVVEIWPAENPFGEIPVFHFRNDRPYGEPEHAGFYGPQDAITKLIVSHMSGVDYQSLPQRYALVDPDSDSGEAADLDEDDFDFELDPTADQNQASKGQGTSQFTSEPGSLWYMQGVKGVGQFETADPDTFLRPMERYLRFGAQICSTPLRFFDYETSRMPSGASQTQADRPFVKKIRNRQLSYGGTWQDVFVFALKILGVEDVEVMVNWAPAETVDDEAGWNVVAAKIANGVPTKQALMEAGYTDDQVKEFLGGQTETLAERLAHLKQVAEVAGQLKSAVDEGLLTQEQVAEMIATALGNDRDAA
ncbi:hypothetical protein WHI96_07995 [Pseudonocardia tropica]|uniref:Phage portal protein, SPP1 Gp6-like n=1 Tax=Pseudonocardia tropica TaxID=681289 RepID=A0ABV1JS48_9PSEU